MCVHAYDTLRGSVEIKSVRQVKVSSPRNRVRLVAAAAYRRERAKTEKRSLYPFLLYRLLPRQLLYVKKDLLADEVE